MQLNTAIQFIDYVISLLKDEKDDILLVFDFIGGEPLLEIDLINDICEYITLHLPDRLSNYRFGITTNGLLYNSFKVQQFINKYQSLLDINISIDGNKKKNDLNRIFPNGSGSYDLIIQNVKLWIDQYPNALVKMVISSDDLSYVFESACHLISLGIKRLDMNLVVEDVWKDGDDVILEQQLIALADYIVDNKLYNKCKFYIFEDGIGHKFSKEDALSPCRESFLTVDASGTLYTCLRFAPFSLKNKSSRSVGDLNNGINWNHLRPFYLLNNLTVYAEECLNCKIASGCRWCPGENYDTSELGSIFHKATAICKMHKARVRAKNYYENRVISNKEGRIWNL